MKTKLNFNIIALFTPDSRKMVGFYRDVMGFETGWNGESRDVRKHPGDVY